MCGIFWCSVQPWWVHLLLTQLSTAAEGEGASCHNTCWHLVEYITRMVFSYRFHVLCFSVFSLFHKWNSVYVIAFFVVPVICSCNGPVSPKLFIILFSLLSLISAYILVLFSCLNLRWVSAYSSQAGLCQVISPKIFWQKGDRGESRKGKQEGDHVQSFWSASGDTVSHLREER